MEVRHCLWAGEFDKAEAALRLLDKASYSQNRRLGTKEEGRAQMHYADLRMMQGHPAHAIKHAALAQQRFAFTKDADGIVETRAITAAAYRMLSDFGAADVFFELASQATAGINDEPARNERRRLVLCNRGHVLILADRIEDGLKYLDDSIEMSIVTRTASPDGGAESLVRFANALLVRGSFAEAESYLSHARVLAQQSDRRWIGGIIGKVAADLYLATGQFEEARKELSSAWSANSSGFLFQQRELMKRIRASPEVCPEELERFLRVQHNGCSRCGGRSIPRMAACSLSRRSNFLFA
jgi:tetratricopeptide (TPR) repeat protein